VKWRVGKKEGVKRIAASVVQFSP